MEAYHAAVSGKIQQPSTIMPVLALGETSAQGTPGAFCRVSDDKGDLAGANLLLLKRQT